MLFVILHKNNKKKKQSEEAEILTFLKLDITFIVFQRKKNMINSIMPSIEVA